MCEISDKIKFCTCVKGHYSKLPHYWLYYRVGEMKDSIMMGIAIMPQYLNRPDYIENQFKLVGRLNDLDAFDFAIQPLEGDRFEIVLNNLTKQRADYHFIYEDNNWEMNDYDYFEVTNHRIKKIAKGPIRFEDSSSE
jgi:hypothetical protein